MTKDEIDASGAPHSGIRSTSPPSKEVALADEPALADFIYETHNYTDCVEKAKLLWPLLSPAVGMREALAVAQKALQQIEATSSTRAATISRDALSALATLQSVQPPAGEGLEAALRDIISWKEDTLGVRPKVQGPYDCAPEITEAFDRGARMAFYRCAIRASAALAQSTRPPSLVDREALIDQAAQIIAEKTSAGPAKWPDDWTPGERMVFRGAAAAVISALSGTTAERGAERTALEQARDALIKIRKCSIAGCEEGYGKPEKWADDLFRSHGDVAAALKTIDTALSSATAGREETADWMTCESRAAWVRNSLKHRIDDWRKHENSCRKAYTKDWMGDPANYLADAYAEARAIFQRRLDALRALSDSSS